MDKKEFITAITLSALVIGLWMFWQSWSAKNHPPLPAPMPTTSTNPPPAATPPSLAPGPATTNAASPRSGLLLGVGAAATAPATDSIGPANSEAANANANANANTLTIQKQTSNPVSMDVAIGSPAEKDPTFAMQIRFPDRAKDSQVQGDGLDSVLLNQFHGPRKNRNDKTIYEFETQGRDNRQLAALATQSVTIDGVAIDLWDKVWTMEPQSADLATHGSHSSAAFFIVILRGGKPVARIRKEYALQTIEATKTTSEGYEVAVTQTIQNLDPAKPIKVRTALNGTTAPPSEIDQQTDHFLVTGYKVSDAKIRIAQKIPTEIKPDPNSTKMNLTEDSAEPFSWVGLASAYFVAIVRPDVAGNSQITVSAEAKDPAAPIDRKIALTLDTPEMTVVPGQQLATVPLTVYFGPKWRDVLANAYYSAPPRMYDQTLSVQSKICLLPEWCSSWCSWPFLIHGLVWILIWFHKVTRDWGLAIIGLVCIVRIFLHPLTKKAQVRMMKMSKLAPAIEKLKEKYAEQPDVLNREMMKLHKEQIGAMLGCLPTFLQMPIWIALYTALQGTFELRQAPFLWGLTWIKDLAKPDGLFQFAEPINLFFFHLSAINILPLLMAIVTFVNTKYFTPKPIPIEVTATKPAQREKQEKQKAQQDMQLMMNNFMPLIFPLIMYSMPSGLNLYYLTSMSLQIIESKIIRNHIKRDEELEKLRGPELVATKATRGARRGGDKNAPAITEKPGMLERFMAYIQKVQEQAEQMKKETKKGKR